MKDDKHTIRNAVIATIIGGLILSFILWLLGFLPNVWEWIKTGTVWLCGAITSELSVPVWLLGLLLVFSFPLLWRVGVKILSIVVPRKEQTMQTATGNADVPVGIRDQLSENELLALRALTDADGGPPYLDDVSRAIGQNQLRAEQVLDLLVKKGLVRYSSNYAYGTSYYLSDQGRDLAIELGYA